MTYKYISNENYVLIRVRQLWKNTPNATMNGDGAVSNMKIVRKPCDSCPVCFIDEGNGGDGIAANDFVSDGTGTEFETCCIDDYATMIVVVKDGQSNSCNSNPYGLCDGWPSTQDTGHSLYWFQFTCTDTTMTPSLVESPSASILPTDMPTEASTATSNDPTPTRSPATRGASYEGETDVKGSSSSPRPYSLPTTILCFILNAIL